MLGYIIRFGSWAVLRLAFVYETGDKKMMPGMRLNSGVIACDDNDGLQTPLPRSLPLSIEKPRTLAE
jgi:hypothetical protein